MMHGEGGILHIRMYLKLEVKKFVSKCHPFPAFLLIPSIDDNLIMNEYQK